MHPDDGWPTLACDADHAFGMDHVRHRPEDPLTLTEGPLTPHRDPAPKPSRARGGEGGEGGRGAVARAVPKSVAARQVACPSLLLPRDGPSAG